MAEFVGESIPYDLYNKKRGQWPLSFDINFSLNTS